MDDGSTANTKEVISQFKYIRYIYITRKCRASTARNNAIPHSNGEYLLFLDADTGFTENFLNESNTSILNQSYKDFEFLIVNDGSTDRSDEIIRSISTQFAILRVKNSLTRTQLKLEKYGVNIDNIEIKTL